MSEGMRDQAQQGDGKGGHGSVLDRGWRGSPILPERAPRGKAASAARKVRAVACELRRRRSEKPGALMPPQGKAAGGNLTDEQVQYIVAYLQSLQ